MNAPVPVALESLPTGHLPRAVALAVLLSLLSLPLWFKGDFILFLATQAGVMMLVAIGLNFLTGYAGQVSLGHGALVAIGVGVDDKNPDN